MNLYFFTEQSSLSFLLYRIHNYTYCYTKRNNQTNIYAAVWSALHNIEFFTLFL